MRGAVAIFTTGFCLYKWIGLDRPWYAVVKRGKQPLYCRLVAITSFKFTMVLWGDTSNVLCNLYHMMLLIDNASTKVVNQFLHEIGTSLPNLCCTVKSGSCVLAHTFSCSSLPEFDELTTCLFFTFLYKNWRNDILKVCIFFFKLKGVGRQGHDNDYQSTTFFEHFDSFLFVGE